jgi:hypothetical protein
LSAQVTPAFAEGHSPLEQQSTQLIDHPGSSGDEAIANSMQRLQIELLIALDRDETHRRPLHRFCNCFGSM